VANLIDLRAVRILKRNRDFTETMRREAEDALADALSADVSRMNGRQLRQLRDGILELKQVLLVCSPEGRRRIGQKVEEMERDLTLDETMACFPPVSVSFV